MLIYTKLFILHKELPITFKHLHTLLFLTTCTLADTIYFNNGAVVEGVIKEQTKQTVTIEVSGKSTTYAMHDVKNVETLKVSPPPAAVTSPPPTENKVLKSGSTLQIKTTSSLSSREHSEGHQFSVKLESNMMDHDVVLVPAGTTLYGSVLQSQQAGRLVGNSSLVVSLNAIVIEGKKITVHTNKVNVINKTSQGRNTTKKVARGAIIGGLINGSDGAKDGAKVGAGAAVLTRGEATGIPAGTLLSFTLTSDVKL